MSPSDYSQDNQGHRNPTPFKVPNAKRVHVYSNRSIKAEYSQKAYTTNATDLAIPMSRLSSIYCWTG